MTNLYHFLVLGFLTTRIFAADPPAPFGMTWSTSSFGPDGPWQAVQISIGTPAQQVALYPGGTFRSHFISSEICLNETISQNACQAQLGGLYSVERSATALQSVIRLPAATDFSHGGLQVQGSDGIGALDQMNIGTSDSFRTAVIVPNVTIAIHQDIAAVYPSGRPKALQVGTLGLGYLGTVNQSFSHNGEPSINGSLIPGYLQAAKITPSNSFGLQIGSVRHKIKGSLYFGGYDQSRICGNISTQKGAFAGMEPNEDGRMGLIDILDIAINVVEGASPFNSSSIRNLLSAGNSTIGRALSVSLLPEAPYLNLPKSTCDAIAAWLPVTYNPGLGLYIWNTKSPLYNLVTTSPTVLTFTFRADQTNTRNLTVHVPFLLLNLTLSPPLVASDTAYFPCNAVAPNGQYSLGRSFLQAAFVGANWNAGSNQGVWWLAQAAGPNIGTQSNIRSIRGQDSVVFRSANEWKPSWRGVWQVLSSEQVDGSRTATTGGTVPSSTATSSSINAPNPGLSALQKSGIGSGIAVMILGFIGLGVFLLLRKRREKKLKYLQQTSGTWPEREEMNRAGEVSFHLNYRNGGFAPAELNTHETKNENVYAPVELHSYESQNGRNAASGKKASIRYELDGNVYR